MSTFAKVILILIGICLLLPGLCYLGFGLLFVQASLSEHSIFKSVANQWAGHLLIGAVLTALAIVIFFVNGKSGR